MFLEWLEGSHRDWYVSECTPELIKGFLYTEQLDTVRRLSSKSVKSDGVIETYIRKCINENHADMIKWIKEMPFYYKTDKQIFVHAGVDEEAGEEWELGTPNYVYTEKYPPTVGHFCMDIIAGHSSVQGIAENAEFDCIFFDGESHYYIDGCVEKTKRLLCLAYDEESGKYYELRDRDELCGWYKETEPIEKYVAGNNWWEE